MDVYENAIRQALASSQMEAFCVTAEIEENVRKIVCGELTIENYIESVISEHRKSSQFSKN